MEVLDSRVTLLTNMEVLQLLKQVKKEEDKKQKNNRGKLLSTIIYETSKYLKSTPAVVQNKEDIEKLIRDLASFKLTPAEIMQIINIRPTSSTEIQLIVEESEERFKTEEQLDALVNVITEALPSRPTSRAT